MTLTYDFDDRYFEYEPDSVEVNSYIEGQPVEVLADRAEDSFSKLSEQERSRILTDIINSGDYHWLKKQQDGTNVKYSINWEVALEEDKDYVMEFIDEDDFKDELHDYFYSKASEQFDECEAERKDPYGYRGLSPRDFY